MSENSENTPSRSTILRANQNVHSALANSGEYNKSPHFHTENQEKVGKLLKNLIPPERGKFRKILDMGCGTGFIIHLALDLADEIHGVDITDSMMEQVDTSSGRVFLQNSEAESTPYPDDEFELVTAYSFLDHLEDYKPVLQEALRVLKPGGVFYSDLNPNRHFAHLMLDLEGDRLEDMPEVVSREIKGMLHNGEYYEKEFGIDAQDLVNAEPMKTFDHGFDPDDVVRQALTMGYSQASYEYDWYLGQAIMIHQHSPSKATEVEQYLRMALPATRGLFKYVRFYLEK